MSKLAFNTAKILKDTRKATAAGLDETVEAAADDARGTTMNLPPHEAAGHPWYGVTPRVERAVSTSPAKRSGTKTTASFGASKRRGDYALFLERLRPYLRPVAKRHFPGAAKSIGKRMG